MTINSYWYLTFLLTLIFLSLQTNLAKNDMRCIESERRALLFFKYDLVDRDNILSSWNEENNDCCNWTGVRCSNATGHVISLDLHGPHGYNNHRLLLEGKIGSSLINLSHLIYLDLSYNSFDQISIFKDVGSSLVNLKYLNLSYNSLKGVIPYQLGNLSKLSTLDLQWNFFSNYAHDSFTWVSNLSSLKYLYLSGLYFGGAIDWTSVISKLTLLKRLSLDNCNLPQAMLSSHSTTNSSRILSRLNLRNNNFNSLIFPWLLNFRNSVVYLDLSFNNLQGLTMDDFRNMASLEFIELSSTYVDFSSPTSFENYCNLKQLSLYKNNIGGLLIDFLKNFPQCVLDSLQYLELASNNFFGPLPNFVMFSSLKGLDLFHNTLNGTIPQSIGQMSNLEYLYLGQTSLKGEIDEAHFSKLTNLRELDLSENSLILNFKSNWIPPFQLEAIFLRSCNLGPYFPKWLQTQNFSFLDISDNKISDAIPHWFWNNLSVDLQFMNLSENKIKGEIPNLSVKVINIWHRAIFLNGNRFLGQVPSFLLETWVLNLSNNKFSSIVSLCDQVVDSPLYALDLSNNQLSSQLPDCWDHMTNLKILYLANNTLSGAIPSSMGSLNKLNKLNLRNNQFSGELPHWFNFTNLVVFDLTHNHLCGIIPSWIGFEFPNLVHLNFKANQFHGILPSSLCNLKNLEVLDISSNNITGSIPTCIHNFNVLTRRSNSSPSYEGDLKRWIVYYSSSWTLFQNGLVLYLKDDMILTWKGQDRTILGPLLKLQRSIDLSCNHLNGEIPSEITELVGLITLNLSSNNLTGQIPEKIGQLRSLESLDLSRNHLSGQIPPSFSQISALSVLNLSYNNFSGKIPLGTQLQTLTASSFEGNPYLCGVPLNTCSKVDIQDQYINTIQDEAMTREWLISISLGFVVGFWGIFGSLVLHRKWRHVYFKFLNKIVNKVT